MDGWLDGRMVKWMMELMDKEAEELATTAADE
jgi:hypothetical protein